jgi:signal transduction histidine kinase
VQIAGLLALSLVTAQALSLVAIMLTPPPRPPIYRLAELADALRGGALTPAYGYRLARETDAWPPPQPLEADAGGPNPVFAQRRALASLLGRPEDEVRLIPHGRSALSDITAGRLPPYVRRPFDLGPDAPFGPDGRRDAQVVIGKVVAAVKEADGNWTTIRSVAPFPTDWQVRISLWALVSLLVVSGASYLFARRIGAPLDRFAEAAQRLGRDPRAPPMALSGPAELTRAAEAFNDMQARIRRYVEDRMGMVAAVSHDLRTPLARMRFKLEAPKPDKTSLLKDIGQMEEMIAAVLVFIREAADTGHRERLDLLSVIECAADDAARLGADVRIEADAPLLVEADPLALQRLFGALIDNALKYGRHADARVFAFAGEAVVEIKDDGPGLPQPELERVFIPFYRTDAARNLDAGGVGLGLAVARSIARAHGGDLVLKSDAAGLTAVTRLPLARAA